MHEDEAEYSPSGGGDNEEENDEDDEDEDEAEYSPSGSDDEEEYDEDEDKLESSEFNSHILEMSLLSTSDPHPPAAANAVRFHLDDRQYQSVEFYNAEKRLIDRYEEVSGGVKADISPDPLSLSQEMKKAKE